MFVPVQYFDVLHLLLYIVTANGLFSQQLDVKAAFVYIAYKETIYLHHPEGYRDGNKVAHFQKCIYRLTQSAKEWYLCHTSHLRKQAFDTSKFDPCILQHKRDQIYITVFVDDLTLYRLPR
jgi:rhamnogalacturonyl hydrolase YesR